MGRILGVDYGEKRIGLALSDPTKIIASGLETASPYSFDSMLETLLNKYDIDKIVIGFPNTSKAKESEMTTAVRIFADRIHRKYPALPIEFFDERLTSKMAQQTIRDAGAKKKQRRDKKLVDKVAAVIILQNYLDANRV